MLAKYLNGAIEDLQTLISYTKLDIDDIKLAKHEDIFARNIKKDTLISEFETKKRLITQEFQAIKNKHPNKDLQDILSKDIIDLCGDMRSSLDELKKINSDYARIVFAVSEFFNSLIQKMIPQESHCYNKSKKTANKPAVSLIQVKA